MKISLWKFPTIFLQRSFGSDPFSRQSLRKRLLLSKRRSGQKRRLSSFELFYTFWGGAFSWIILKKNRGLLTIWMVLSFRSSQSERLKRLVAVHAVCSNGISSFGQNAANATSVWDRRLLAGRTQATLHIQKLNVQTVCVNRIALSGMPFDS